MKALLAFVALVAMPAQAQIVSPIEFGAPVDTSSLATKAEVSAVAAMVPLRANALPPAEAVGGIVGTSPRYRGMDDAAPRITRATTVSTIAGGTFSGTWTTPMSGPPTIVMTPIAASASIDCQLTSAPTATTFAGRCWTSQSTVLNLGIITAGLTLLPTTPTAAGVSIQIIAIPPTQ